MLRLVAGLSLRSGRHREADTCTQTRLFATKTGGFRNKELIGTAVILRGDLVPRPTSFRPENENFLSARESESSPGRKLASFALKWQEFCLRLEENYPGKFRLKTKPGQPYTRLIPESVFQPQNLGPSLQQVLDSWSERAGMRANVKEPLLDRYRNINPLTALQASPGSGKSYFLDAVGSFFSQPAVTDQDRLDFRGSIPVSITFNSQTPYDDDLAKNIPIDVSIAARMLFMHYFQDGVWEYFLLDFAPTFCNDPLLTIAVDLISTSFGEPRCVILLIDEILKTGPNFATVLSKACTLLDTFGSDSFNMLVSTLNLHPFQQHLMGSEREIQSILLIPPTTEQVFKQICDIDPILKRAKKEDLHQAIVHSPAILKAGPGPEIEQFRRASVLYALLDICGGHWRSLERAAQLWIREAGDGNEKLAPGITFHWLRNKLIYAPAFAPVGFTLDTLSPCLLSEEVSLNQRLGSWSVAELIIRGAYMGQWNTSPQVPRVVPLRLYRWADGSTTPEERHVALFVQDLMSVRSDPSLPFERLVTSWLVAQRALRSTILPHDGTAQLFPKPTSLSAGPPPHQAQGNILYKQSTFVYPEPAVFSFQWDNIPEFKRHLPSEPALTQRAIRFASNNPAFETMLILPSAAVAGAYVLVGVGTKYSKPDSTTRLRPDDVRSKIKKFIQVLVQHHLSKTSLSQMRLESFCLAMFGTREATSSFQVPRLNLAELGFAPHSIEEGIAEALMQKFHCLVYPRAAALLCMGDLVRSLPRYVFPEFDSGEDSLLEREDRDPPSPDNV
eukprot:TRINITY_DN4303_c0_g1_i1.p1 TRINITY_DN4303_c0_g1~~TRINITY_DN4303_c0_g1_i1.p1  ORF type:complete len:787 (-),score=61.34 TRINITY_DN4303_c0_g1_i1:42-2402(-)